ncbi:MAG: hypothetical protein ACI4HN_08945 [Ruminococcus sp.]
MGNQPPLSMVLQSARMEMLRAANSVMLTYKLPPCLMDCVVSALIADIRAQVSSELVRDIQNSAKDGKSESELVRNIQNSAKDGETENE